MPRKKYQALKDEKFKEDALDALQNARYKEGGYISAYDLADNTPEVMEAEKASREDPKNGEKRIEYQMLHKKYVQLYRDRAKANQLHEGFNDTSEYLKTKRELAARSKRASSSRHHR